MTTTTLLDSLGAVRTRVKLFGALYGVGLIVASALAIVLAIILIDFVIHLPVALRLIALVAGTALLVFGVIRFVAMPLLSKLTISDVAGKVELAFPQFDDRLRSTVTFLQQDIPGSDVMKDRVISEATQLAQSVDMNRTVLIAPVRKAVLLALGAILLTTILASVVNPSYVRIALMRLFAPMSTTEWPKRYEIQLVGSTPSRVPVGQRVNVAMKLKDNKSAKATVFYQYGNGAVQKELMARGEDGTFASSLDSRANETRSDEQLKVWIEAGDDRKELPAITIVPRLEIKGVTAIVTPPEYAGNRSTTFDLSRGPALVTAGSKIELRVLFNKNLSTDADAASVPIIEPIEEAKVPTDLRVMGRATGQSLSVGWTASESMRFHVRATDVDNFQNPGLEEFQIIVRPDQNPSVQIENPRRNEDRTPVAVIPLQGSAEDDFDIQSLQLMVVRLGDKKEWKIDLVKEAKAQESVAWDSVDASAERKRFRVQWAWDLAKLEAADLKPGDVLEYHLLVRDNYALAGKVHDPVPSGKLRISIISQEELSARIMDDLRNVAGQINDIRNGQIRTQQETKNLQAETKDKPKLDEADQQVASRLANQQSTSAAQSKQIAGKMQEVMDRLEENKSTSQELKDLSKDVRDKLNTAAEGPMKDAANDLNDTKRDAEKQDERNKALDDAQKSQTEADQQLQSALNRMGSIGTLSRTIDDFNKLLQDQQKVTKETGDLSKKNIGKTPEQMSPEDREKLEKLAKDQKDLSERTDKAIKDMEATSKQLEKSDPQTSKSMESAAETGKQQQVSQNQSKASESTKQNQQSRTNAAQKQAELGLEMVLNELKEAEKRKLEELSRKLEELQKQLALLVRRQAGHNLDNLGNQGPDRLKQLKAEDLDLLLEQAERPKEQQPKVPELGILTGGQEQTERNTRSLAESIADMQNSTEISTNLTRAAGKMERAIVSLRDKKLPEAYDPSQVEALAALLDAKKTVDEQKKEVDDKQESQERETIRAAFIKIKEDQEKLNAETVRIDKSRNPADATLKREDAIKLGQLPGDQGKLAERIKKTGEDLKSLGSIVYVWANKDIHSTMESVKEELGGQKTDIGVQVDQKRVVAQLDSMIKNLEIKPEEEKDNFEEPSGGGQGESAGGAPPLPTESELRLLKDLQLAINDSTKVLDAQPKKDMQRLDELGGRQGEMRALLDQLLQKASKGQIKLGPEPDNKDQLPEEANAEDVDNQELADDLLGGKPGAEKMEKDVNKIGDRMARSRQRLALNDDPGKVTQLIQERIAMNLDDLIKQAKSQQKQQSSQGQAKGQQKPKPQPGDGQKPANEQANGKQQEGAQPNEAATPAGGSQPRGGGEASPGEDIKEKMSEWGGLTPRDRQAVIEGASETIIEKYKGLLDDYYRTLAERSSERR